MKKGVSWKYFLVLRMFAATRGASVHKINPQSIGFRPLEDIQVWGKNFNFAEIKRDTGTSLKF